jgi:hypothetical protein
MPVRHPSEAVHSTHRRRRRKQSINNQSPSSAPGSPSRSYAGGNEDAKPHPRQRTHKVLNQPAPKPQTRTALPIHLQLSPRSQIIDQLISPASRSPASPSQASPSQAARNVTERSQANICVTSPDRPPETQRRTQTTQMRMPRILDTTGRRAARGPDSDSAPCARAQPQAAARRVNPAHVPRSQTSPQFAGAAQRWSDDRAACGDRRAAGVPQRVRFGTQSSAAWWRRRCWSGDLATALLHECADVLALISRDDEGTRGARTCRGLR